ncbi:Rho GTPase activation protein [Chytridium lagenaria]|nr:Rho GTPase activation protein [Chytridium lagenaria]
MWQDYPPVFYWHVSEGESKDLVFGVPLDVHLKATGRPVPYVLQKCIRAIESRGLKKEGIYRISAKHSDIIELRQKLEKDIAKVNLDDDVIDVHVICGVVKMFLRELPKPLLEIPDIERKEYVKKSPEDRVRSIQFFLKNENRATLKYLIYHLATVAQFCEDNKMTPQNLAVVFGPPILTNTQKDKDWSSGDTKTKAQQFLDKMQQSFLPESQKASSPSGMSPASSATELNLELAKNDIIIEELMREREIIFPSEKSSKREKKSRSTAEFPSRFDSLPLNGVAPVVGNVTTPSTPRPTLSASADSVSSSPLSAALSYVPTPIQIQTPNLQTVPNPVPVGLVGQPTSGSASPTSTFVDNPLPVTLSTPAVTAYPIAAPDAIPPPPPTNLPQQTPSSKPPGNPPSLSPNLYYRSSQSSIHHIPVVSIHIASGCAAPAKHPPPPQTLSASMAPSQGSSMAYRSPSQGFAFLAPSMTPAAAFTGEKRAGDGANGNA